jgi:RNA polymerase sigma-70 factor (ECF subfamily)
MEKGNRFQGEGSRDELRVFFYRMTGSLREAEGMVEALFFQAGGLPIPLADKALALMELYKISMRLCLEALSESPARGLPSTTYPPSDPYLPPLQPEEGLSWLEPFPDDLLPEIADPSGGRYGEIESISLPFIAALQDISPLQRASLILADVLGWKASVLAEAMGMGVFDAQRTLDEARESMARTYHPESRHRESLPEEKEGVLSIQYLYAWEVGDTGGLAERLSEDVVLQLLPSPTWYRGRDAVKQHISSHEFAAGARGRWRMLPRRSNGQLAFGVYEGDTQRRAYRAHSIQVLCFDGELVSEIVACAYPSLFPLFKLLPEVTVQG